MSLGAQEGRLIVTVQQALAEIEGKSAESENLIGRFGLHRSQFSRSDKTVAALNNDLQAGSTSEWLTLKKRRR